MRIKIRLLGPKQALAIALAATSVVAWSHGHLSDAAYFVLLAIYLEV